MRFRRIYPGFSLPANDRNRHSAGILARRHEGLKCADTGHSRGRDQTAGGRPKADRSCRQCGLMPRRYSFDEIILATARRARPFRHIGVVQEVGTRRGIVGTALVLRSADRRGLGAEYRRVTIMLLMQRLDIFQIPTEPRLGVGFLPLVASKVPQLDVCHESTIVNSDLSAHGQKSSAFFLGKQESAGITEDALKGCGRSGNTRRRSLRDLRGRRSSGGRGGSE